MAVARRLHRRWPLPSAVEPDDIAQELRLGVLLAWPKFDPARGTPRDGYLWWNATAHAQGWLHAQRAALRRRGCSPSAHAIAFGSLGDFDADSFPVEGLDPDEGAALLEVVRHLLAVSASECMTYCATMLRDGGFARDDWHARVLASRSIGMFTEVLNGDKQEGFGG